MKDKIKNEIKKVLKELGVEGIEPQVELTADLSKGDYSSNIAMAMFSSSKFKFQNSKFGTPMELAEKIAAEIEKLRDKDIKEIERIETAKPGFINFWLSKDYLITRFQRVPNRGKRIDLAAISKFKDKKIMVEFAHPNTHKEMHIGHMRTLITGEAIARIFEALGAKVFRANYQGDVGPHVAKALVGVQQIMRDKNLSLDVISKWSNKEKAHFLGEGYVIGNKLYEEEEWKNKINGVNSLLYRKLAEEELILKEDEEKIWDLYRETRQWSLDYYDEFYTKFYTRFDRLFFESEVADCGKKIVLENVGSPRASGEAGKIFEESDGAVIFPGEKYGLHNRVFVTKAGYPTYEGKDMCLAFKQYEAFPFDKNIHIVASEQTGYFKVVIKALEILDPEKFKDKEYHLSMGMVQLAAPSTNSGQARKISSRTGEVLTVDWLVDQVKASVLKLLQEGRGPNSKFEIRNSKFEGVVEQITIGAIKYSVLKVNDLQNVMFDIEKSVSLEGNSGPYLQYTFARTQSVLAKVKNQKAKVKSHLRFEIARLAAKRGDLKLEIEEVDLLRIIHRFSEAVSRAGEGFAPNLLCNYLFDLAQKFNLFYQKHSILESEYKDFRLTLTKGTGEVLKAGLGLLGIEAPDRM